MSSPHVVRGRPPPRKQTPRPEGQGEKQSESETTWSTSKVARDQARASAAKAPSREVERFVRPDGRHVVIHTRGDAGPTKIAARSADGRELAWVLIEPGAELGTIARALWNLHVERLDRGSRRGRR